MEKYIEEKEIYEKIKEVIYSLCPIKKPRMKFDEEGFYQNICLRIYFYFYEDSTGKIITQLSLLKEGKQLPISYLTNQKIKEDTIKKIMEFIFSEFPYVNNLQTRLNGFDIDCGIGLENFLDEGISCNKISIIFETHPKLCKDFSDLFENYLTHIMTNFINHMERAPQIRDAYKKYKINMQKRIINNLDYEELKQLIMGLTEEKLRELLISMNSDNFFELCDKIQQNTNPPKTLKLIRETPIRIIDTE